MITNRDGFADLSGLSPSTVNRRLAQGMPGRKLPTGEWEIDTADATNWLVEREAKKRRPGERERDAADTRVATAKAGLAEHRLGEEQRLWLHVDDVAELIGEQFAVIRTAATRLPDLADQLAAETDPAVCRRIMLDGVNRVLAEIAAAEVG